MIAVDKHIVVVDNTDNNNHTMDIRNDILVEQVLD